MRVPFLRPTTMVRHSADRADPKSKIREEIWKRVKLRYQYACNRMRRRD